MSSWWRSEPTCGRGTFKILSDCLFTIIFAVWTVRHPETPQNLQATPPKKSLLDRISNSKDIFLFIILPEYAAAIAINQVVLAVKLRYRMRVAKKWPDWTFKQSFAIIMGAVYLAPPPEPESSDATRAGGQRQGGFRARLANYLNPIAKREPGAQSDGPIPLDGTMRLDQILPVDMPELPDNKALDRRSKSDTMAKCLAVAQALGFLLTNICSRLLGGAAISPLEAVTCAYLVCALVTWLSYLAKPHELQDPIRVEVSRPVADAVRGSLGNNDNRRRDKNFWIIVSGFLTSGIIAVVSILLTWDTPFATKLERELWRVTNFLTLALGPVLLLRVCVENGTVIDALLGVLSLNRLAVVGQSIAAFRVAEDEIYKKPSWQWTNYWPSFGV
ncbi:hypothetical protein F5X68DRAFT_254106 [Plectosphaerella plurivora]|uniref:Uncharacterized protein n=1 Tax=Plectosphaerella plurivora TaxID=936078 RepID=A0A9P8VEZ5_9PEZI|nr:hypothetical protein F5X68DRAFT_254106 [Plectosphaerella plurivora]